MHSTFHKAFHKILNAINDINCHKVLIYVANKFLRFDLSQRLCTGYNVIQKIGGK